MISLISTIRAECMIVYVIYDFRDSGKCHGDEAAVAEISRTHSTCHCRTLQKAFLGSNLLHLSKPGTGISIFWNLPERRRHFIITHQSYTSLLDIIKINQIKLILIFWCLEVFIVHDILGRLLALATILTTNGQVSGLGEVLL